MNGKRHIRALYPAEDISHLPIKWGGGFLSLEFDQLIRL